MNLQHRYPVMKRILSVARREVGLLILSAWLTLLVAHFNNWLPLTLIPLLISILFVIRIALGCFPQALLLFTQEDPEDHASPNAPKALATALRQRAGRSRSEARLFLWLTVLCIVLGFFIFRNAEDTIRMWDGTVTRPRQIDVQNKESELNSLLRQRTSKDAHEARTLEGGVAFARESLDRAWQREQEAWPSRNPTIFLGLTVGTKIGIVTLVIFLVKILLTTYRYSTRLATFNESRADLFAALPADAILTAETLKKMLSPDRVVEFDEVPDTPAFTGAASKGLSG